MTRLLLRMGIDVPGRVGGEACLDRLVNDLLGSLVCRLPNQGANLCERSAKLDSA